MDGKKILVAYFSWSGRTQLMARMIAAKLGADLFEIVRAAPYPSQYTACTEEAQAEKDEDARPALLGKVRDIARYDTVFVGTPVWWYTAPMPVFSFLEQHDLRGKTVIPFCTCHTDEYSTLRDIEKATRSSLHRRGLSVQTRDLPANGIAGKEDEIVAWLRRIGF